MFTRLDVPRYMQVFKHLLSSALAYLIRKEIEIEYDVSSLHILLHLWFLISWLQQRLTSC